MAIRRTQSVLLVVAAAIALVFSTGLGAGWLLQRFDANTGFLREADRIAEVLDLDPGDRAGDIRAGEGQWTVDMARRVGPQGQVFATAGPQPAHLLLKTVADSGLDNITVITQAPGDAARLPSGCCDAILMRFVYSDLKVERPTLVPSLALLARPGALLAIIDVNPSGPTGPGRQTMSRQAVVQDITSHGFELVQEYESWFGNTYCVVVRRPAGS